MLHTVAKYSMWTGGGGVAWRKEEGTPSPTALDPVDSAAKCGSRCGFCSQVWIQVWILRPKCGNILELLVFLLARARLRKVSGGKVRLECPLQPAAQHQLYP